MLVSSVVFVLAYAISLVKANNDFYITKPFAETKWCRGTTQLITWNFIPGGCDFSTIDIELMDGDDTNADVVATIATGLSRYSTSYSWNIQDWIIPSSSYFIRLTGNCYPPNYRYSHRFSIECCGNTPKPSSSCTSSNASTATKTATTSNGGASGTGTAKTTGTSKTTGSTSGSDATATTSTSNAAGSSSQGSFMFALMAVMLPIFVIF